MSADFRELIEREDFQPYLIRTRDGRSYPVTHRSNARISAAYPDTVVVAVPRKGINLVRLRAIDSIEFDQPPRTSNV